MYCLLECLFIVKTFLVFKKERIYIGVNQNEKGKLSFLMSELNIKWGCDETSISFEETSRYWSVQF